MMGFPRSRLSSVLQQQHILSPRPFSAEVTPQFIPTANISRRRFRSNTRNQAPLQPTSKRTRAPAQNVFQKSIHVFEFDPHNSARFTKTSDNIVVTGVLSPIAVSATEAEVREEIRDFIQHARSDSHLFVDVKSYDFEFIQVSGKNPDAPVSALQTMYSICDGDFHETVEVMLSGPTFTHIQEAFWQHKLRREYRTLTMDPNDLIGSAVPYYK